MVGERRARVLVIADKTADTPELLAAIRARRDRGPAQFRVVIPNPAAAELHLLHPERHDKTEEAELALLQALPTFEEAAGGRVIGSVSVRHDPMDAIEEILLGEPIDEIILSVTARGLSRWLHQDLQHRLRHFGLCVTTVQSPLRP